MEGFLKATSCSEIRLCLGYLVSKQVISQSDVLTFSQLNLFNLAISEKINIIVPLPTRYISGYLCG